MKRLLILLLFTLSINTFFGRSFSKWKRLAEEGRSYPMVRMGVFYLEGKAVPLDYSVAMTWFQQAAALGDAVAMRNVGFMYANGYGVPKDYAQAIQWYDKADSTCLVASRRARDLWYSRGAMRKRIRKDKEDVLAKIREEEVYANQKQYVKPAIDWLAGTSTTEKSFKVKAGIKSDSEVKSVEVTVNGQTYRGISAVGNDGYAMMVNQSVTLSEGQNVIKVNVTNTAGTSTIEKYVTYAAQGGTPAPSPQVAVTDNFGKRIALVIGNAAYTGQALKNPVNDATDISNKLKSLGFDVTLVTNATHEKMNDAISKFGTAVKDYDVALFYYAGHGIQSKGRNYMIPVNAVLEKETQLEFRCTDMDYALAEMEACKMKIVILDACRDDPFTRRWQRTRGAANGRGLAGISDAPVGTYIAYATNPGNTANDGEGRNSPYTKALLQVLDKPGLKIGDVFQETRSQVYKETKGQQTPWSTDALIEGTFYFNRNSK